MTRHQLFLVIGGIIAVVLIYQLPRVVVENETGTEVETTSHDFSVSEADQATFQSLWRLLANTSEIKKSINFADSLADLSLKYQRIDSAAYYADLILALDTSFASRMLAGNIYYDGFQVASDQEKAMEMASQSREILEELLEEQPQQSSLKNKLAMTLMLTDTPMAGVQLLQEVLADDPENRQAIMNLGLLSIRSGQYDKALIRFDRLLALDSTDDEARFYKGVSLAESGNSDEAKAVFNQLIEKEGADPALKATAANYIKDL